MKKILSLVLVAAMMLSMVALAPTASAETGASIEVTDAVASKGDTVTLDYIVTGTTLRSFALVIDFDETRLENPVVTVNTADGLASAKTITGYPYADATVTSTVDGATIDISGGYNLGTLTFTVKEDAPAGDAYVRFNPVPGANIFLCPTSDANDKIYDWTVIDGNVTVLPEGYSAGATTLPSEIDYWEFEEGVIYGWLGEEYEYVVAGDIAIPSQIDGVDVVAIEASRLFGANADITSITIPETVESVAKGAFVALSGCADFYIMGAETELTAKSLGYSGTTNSAKAYTINIHGASGSTAEEYASASANFTFVEYVAPTTVTVVAGDNTSAFEVSGNTIVAPGASRADGRVTVAWDVNGTKVAPGAEVAIDGDTTFTAITVAAPETTNGASIKAADGYAALRFTAEFSIEEYEALVAAFGAKNVKHGMLISTQNQIKKAGEFTHKLATKLDFEMKGCWKIEDGNYVFAASVKNFQANTLAKKHEFNAVAYVGIDLDGNGTVDTYVYGDYDWTCARDAKTILANAIENAATSGLVGDQLTWVKTWLDKFTY